jgi:WD40 repeat protein
MRLLFVVVALVVAGCSERGAPGRDAPERPPDAAGPAAARDAFAPLDPPDAAPAAQAPDPSAPFPARADDAVDRLVGFHPWRVGEVAFSPDGALIASCEIGTQADPASVTLWDARSLCRVRKVGTIPPPSESGYGPGWDSCALDFSPDGEVLALGRTLGAKLQLLNAADGSLRATLPLAAAAGLSFSPDGKRLAVAEFVEAIPAYGQRGVSAVSLFDLPSRRAGRVVRFQDWIGPAWFGPDGRRVFVVGEPDSSFDVAGGRAIARDAPGSPDWALPDHQRGDSSVEVTVRSPDGRWVAKLIGNQTRLERGDGSSPRAVDVPGFPGAFHLHGSLAFSPAGDALVTVVSHTVELGPPGRVQRQSQVQVLDPETGVPLAGAAACPSSAAP